MDLQRRINDLLFERGEKRPWLASTTGIPLSTINNWFTRNRMPGADQLVKVAKAFNTTVEFLVTGEGADNSITPGQRKWLALVEGKSDKQIDRIIEAQEMMKETLWGSGR